MSRSVLVLTCVVALAAAAFLASCRNVTSPSVPPAGSENARLSLSRPYPHPGGGPLCRISGTTTFPGGKPNRRGSVVAYVGQVELATAVCDSLGRYALTVHTKADSIHLVGWPDMSGAHATICVGNVDVARRRVVVRDFVLDHCQ